MVMAYCPCWFDRHFWPHNNNRATFSILICIHCFRGSSSYRIISIVCHEWVFAWRTPHAHTRNAHLELRDWYSFLLQQRSVNAVRTDSCKVRSRSMRMHICQYHSRIQSCRIFRKSMLMFATVMIITWTYYAFFLPFQTYDLSQSPLPSKCMNSFNVYSIFFFQFFSFNNFSIISNNRYLFRFSPWFTYWYLPILCLFSAALRLLFSPETN